MYTFLIHIYENKFLRSPQTKNVINTTHLVRIVLYNTNVANGYLQEYLLIDIILFTII